MPVHTEFLADGRGVLQTGEGVVTAREILDDLVQQRTDPTRPKGHRYVLVDFTQVTRIVARTSDVEQFVREQRSVALHAPEVAIAIAASADVVFALSRMWEGLATGLPWERGVFRTRAEAIEWLRDRRGPVDFGE